MVEVYLMAELFLILKVSEDGRSWLLPNTPVPIVGLRFAMMYELARFVYGDGPISEFGE